MERYNVTGMHCAACVANVERAVKKVQGVESCAVSLLTNSMSVEGSAESEAIVEAVKNAGYGASLKGSGEAEASSNAGKGKAYSASLKEQEEALSDRETPALRRRLILSLGFLIVLMYFSMGHSMLGLPLPSFFEGNALAIGLAEMILSAIVMLINKEFFVNGFRGLWHRSPNMDSLVALGSMASFVWSVYALFRMTGFYAEAQLEAAHALTHQLYFESAAMILALITVGKMLEAHSKGRTTDALKSLMRLAPKTARVLREGVEVEIPIDELSVGDIFSVRPGEAIPTDGVILDGESAVNEAALTGESVPVDKAPGDKVSAATINSSGFLKCRAERVGEDTTLASIIRMVSDAAATKAPIAKMADRVAAVFVPAVIAIAVIVFVIWKFALGSELSFALERAIAVLVISCPCALGLATPVAIMVGSGMGAREGILFKTAASLEILGRAKAIALDKTGTITEGSPRVTDIIPAEGETEESLLQAAVLLEQRSEHPIAGAIMAAGEERGLELDDVDDFKALPGHGLTASYFGTPIVGGSVSFVEELLKESDGAGCPEGALSEEASRLSSEGKTPLAFTRGGKYIGLIAVADTVKEDSARAIEELKELGLRVVMLTGDNEITARAIAKKAGIDEVAAGVLPGGKRDVVRSLQESGATAMVGDGINDAPALTQADSGIAIGAGADVAIDSADIVLVKSRLSDVPAAVRLSRRVLRTVKQGLFWAFIYNVIGIPLAAGALIPINGMSLTPMFGAAAMSLSSFCVVTNALRLRLYDIRGGKGKATRAEN